MLCGPLEMPPLAGKPALRARQADGAVDPDPSLASPGMSLAARFACDALHASAPLARQLHEVALEWSATRKGRRLAAWDALEALCTDGPGSPCPLFTSAQTLVRQLGAHMRDESEPPRVVALGSTPLQLELFRWLVQTHGWRATVLGGPPSPNVSALVLDEAAVAGLREAPLLLLLDSSAGPRSYWARAIAATRPWVALTNESGGGSLADSGLLRRGGLRYESYRAPYASTQHGALPTVEERAARRRAHRAPGRRRLRARWRGGARSKLAAAAPPPPPGLTTMWRLAEGCGLPLWDLRRQPGLALPAEAAAAAAAARSGVPYSEWFACATLEPLRPLARTLFTLPRRRGKSIWDTCVRPHSPCLWYMGTHAEGEGFITQALAKCTVSTQHAHSKAHRDAGSPSAHHPPTILPPRRPPRRAPSSRPRPRRLHQVLSSPAQCHHPHPSRCSPLPTLRWAG